jgi:hypothetical protein
MYELSVGTSVIISYGLAMASQTTGNNTVADLAWDEAHQSLYASTVCLNKVKHSPSSSMHLPFT